MVAVEEGPTLQTRLPSTGTFFLAVADLEERFGADFFYGLAIIKAEPNLAPPTELTATGFKDRVELSWTPPITLEIEPNNAPQQAQELLGPSPVLVSGNAEVDDEGRLELADQSGNPIDDLEDLYVIDLQSSGLRMTLTDLSSDLDLHLINEEITSLVGSSTNSGTSNEIINLPVLSSDRYFIAVSIFDQDPAGPNQSPYTLTIDADLPGGGPTLESYNVYRSEMPVAVTTGEVIANVDATTTSFTDTELPANQFFYQVTAVFDFGEGPPSNEASAVVTSVADNGPNLPTEYALNQNYPNPFNPSTVINYAIPVFHNNQNVTLEIFNTLGQRVRTLVDDVQTAGRYTVEWDGTNEFGNPVTTGLYIYRLRAGTFVKVKKMVFIR
ncbi:T9SS type A sorting domain-containing protein [candidate division KSB1 bacterium]|nr:T9SS type A sorting domain-containing protein [candidate division KSB1 bacterium]NIT73484.1 T9SS type A sorting domain-containing protein [candidate division KSB1 bacterium]NIX73164.1 T9SS type A sorting domain-containing protein [candidate division KSB1 bacterium]